MPTASSTSATTARTRPMARSSEPARADRGSACPANRIRPARSGDPAISGSRISMETASATPVPSPALPSGWQRVWLRSQVDRALSRAGGATSGSTSNPSFGLPWPPGASRSGTRVSWIAAWARRARHCEQSDGRLRRRRARAQRRPHLRRFGHCARAGRPREILRLRRRGRLFSDRATFRSSLPSRFGSASR